MHGDDRVRGGLICGFDNLVPKAPTQHSKDRYVGQIQ